MTVSNATNNRQAAPQTAHSAKSARIRYKLQTAATSAEIGSRGADSFAQLLRKRFHRTPHHPDESDEYHFSLLAWLPRQYATDLPMIYAADDLKTGDLPFLPEQAQMHPGFDFDGPDNPDWLLQLADALLDARRFAQEQLLARQLTYEHDFDAYFTGAKGFRITLRGFTAPGDPRALCDAMTHFCSDLLDRYPSLDTGIYNPSPNAGMIRGPGSKHPKTGLWSIFITKEELLELPLAVAIEQIIQRAQIRSKRQFRACFTIDPHQFLGLQEEPSEALQAFCDLIYQEAIDLAWIKRFQPKNHSSKCLNLEALIESESLEVLKFVYEEQAALLKSCPSCGSTGKAWITHSGRLSCWRSSCEASRARGGLSLREWSQSSHPEELFTLKTPQTSKTEFCSPEEIKARLEAQRERFFFLNDETFEALTASLMRISPGCGKSTMSLLGMLEAVLNGLCVAFVSPNHGLISEQLLRQYRMCQELGIEMPPLLQWRGRDAVNDNGQPMCSQPQRVESAKKDHLPIQKHACLRCPMFKDCNYQKQFRTLGALEKERKELGKGFAFHATHHTLWYLSENKDLLDPSCVVIDEDPIGACLDEKLFTQAGLLKEFAEPATLEVALDQVFEPARALLRQALHKAKTLNQKDYERKLRKAKRKGKNYLPRVQRAISHDGLLELLYELEPDAPLVFARAYQAILDAQEELLSLRDEEELSHWRTMLSPAFQLLPLFEALVSLMPVKEELFDTKELPKKGFSLELRFNVGQNKPKALAKSEEEPQEAQEPQEEKTNQNKGQRKKKKKKKQPTKKSKPTKEKLFGGTFVVVEARSLPYQGPVMGLDATGEELPWQAMLGRPIETTRLDAPLHPESSVDWINLGTYQSQLLNPDNDWIDTKLIPQLRPLYEEGNRILLATWLKENEAGSYKDRVIARLEEAGFPVDGKQLDVVHFFAERGKNRWRDWDVGILWGMPVENPDALRMKCEALAQLVPEEQREALREQLHYQYSAGEAIQDLHRVGAIQEAKKWLIFASDNFLPITDYLKDVCAPGQFRKWDNRSKEAQDPTYREQLETLATELVGLGFFNMRAIAGLMGLDPIARGALIRMDLLDPAKTPLGLGRVGVDHIPIKSGEELQGSLKNYRDLIHTYSARAFRALLGRRELERISRRILELSGWSQEDVTEATLEDDDRTIRPYRVVGDGARGREFLELCSELEGRRLRELEIPDVSSDFSFDMGQGSDWEERLKQCREVVELHFESWRPDDREKVAFEWDNDALLWAYWVVCQWQDEQAQAQQEPPPQPEEVEPPERAPP